MLLPHLIGLTALCLSPTPCPLPAPLGAEAHTPAPASVTSPSAKVFLTVEEALDLCFPKCVIERGTAFLDEDELERIEELAGSAPARAIVHPYRALDEKGELVGTAWFEIHKVRSKKQTLMIAVTPEGTIRRVEVLAFAEPLQYLPPAKWFGQLKGKALGPELSLDGEVRNLAGATLSARASVAAARRVLAIEKVLAEREPSGGQGARR